MRIWTLIVAIFCAGALSLGAMPQASERNGTTDVVTARCVDVIDGDTLVVRLDGHEMIVELDGIDAPELGQPLGREIRGLVRDLVRGREVVVELTGGNSPGCARVAVDGLDLSQLLVERGLAWATDGGPLAESSARAKSARCGIWIEPEPVPPWEFRQIVG